MKKQGFVYVQKDKDGDRVFRGKIAGEDTYAFASITPENRLVRIQLAVSPPENMFWQKYEIIKDSLIEKYGEPYKDDKRFDAPYKEGDGYEAQAIRSGKATYNSEWWTTYTKSPDGSDGPSAIAGLTLYVKDQLIAYITYYSKNWPKEYNRRYKNGTGGL